MMRIRTGSRLHFGLLGLAAESCWPDIEGKPTLPARNFGGLGLMLTEPTLEVRVRPATTWQVQGPLAARALRIAERLLQNVPELSIPPHEITIETAPPEHVGLGVGTQLALAVGQALVKSASGRTLPVEELAVRLGRGLRSGIGVHGFAQGGLILDGGKAQESGVAPLLWRRSLPESWRVLLVIPHSDAGLHGTAEAEAFRMATRAGTLAITGDLCRLILLGLLPALEEGDLRRFGRMLHEFNARSGLLYAPVQQGIYPRPATAQLIAWIRGLGIEGVGQSSWGPTVFCLVGDEAEAAWLKCRLQERCQTEQQIVCARSAVAGAEIVDVEEA